VLALRNRRGKKQKIPERTCPNRRRLHFFIYLIFNCVVCTFKKPKLITLKKKDMYGILAE